MRGGGDLPPGIPRDRPLLGDTHAHLADPAFREDLEAVLERARRAGLAWILVVTEGPEEWDLALDLCRERGPFLQPALGLFPDRASPEAAEALVRKAREHREELAALGEVGLDFRIEGDPLGRRIQEEALLRLCALSRETDLPLSVHSRSAGRRALEVLAQGGAEKVVMHAFDGKARYALDGAERGWCFSIPPSLVRSRQKEKLVKALPWDSLLLESDAPVLGPVPGRRNEPAFLEVTLQRIAEIKGVTPLEAARRIEENQVRLFGPPPGRAGG